MHCNSMAFFMENAISHAAPASHSSGFTHKSHEDRGRTLLYNTVIAWCHLETWLAFSQ